MSWTRGTATPGGSPVTIETTDHSAFPGICWLDATRVLLVYRLGTDHLTDGKIVGKIGTVTDTDPWTFSWGTRFDIYDNAEDVRLEDAVSVIDNKVVIAARLFDGAANHDPFIIICDDAPADFTSSSTWGSPISVPLSSGSVENYSLGRVHKLLDATYLLAVGWTNGAGFIAGVAKSASLTDWSAATFVTVGGPTGSYSEMNVEIMSGANLRAHLRSETATATLVSTSSDNGATWSSPGSSIAAFGWPMFRLLTSGILLTVYRDPPDGDNAYRQSDDDGATWTAQTILDTTGGRSTYATLLQLDNFHVLCPYACETGAASAIYSQVFTDSSTLG